MLAQNFMTAADLGISDKELNAAIKVLGMLERGELQHQRYGWTPETPNGFNMGIAGIRGECGTVACLGGWMAVVMGHKEIHEYANQVAYRPNCSLFNLFWTKLGSDITTEQAAIALRSYLTTGDPRWDLAVA